MSASRNLSFAPKVFRASQLSDGLERIAQSIVEREATIEIMVSERLPDGTHTSRGKQSVESIRTLCDLLVQRTTLDIDIGPKTERGLFGDVIVNFTIRPDSSGFLDVSFRADTPQLLEKAIGTVSRELELDRAPDLAERLKAERIESGELTFPEKFDEIDSRLDALEQSNSSLRDVTCFLSYHFEGDSLGYGAEVKKFLELLGVTVITGEDYEPRPVNEKVRGRLAGEIDLVVVIEVAGRKSAWTRDEMAKAQQPGVALI